jgi:hypothetical protein
MPNIYEEAKQELIEIETYLEHSLDHIAKALERAKKVEELLTYQNHYIDSIVIELDRITNKVKASQIEIIKKELEEMK